MGISKQWSSAFEMWVRGRDIWWMASQSAYFAVAMVALVTALAPLADVRVRYWQEWTALTID